MTSRYPPGTYVMYVSQTCRPEWPAVICSEQMLPRALQERRPTAYVIPILLLVKSQVRWVRQGQLQDFQTLACPEEMAMKHPQLKEAYESMIEGLTDNLPLSHWKELIHAVYAEEGEQESADETVSDREPDYSFETLSEREPGYSFDSDMERAIAASLADQGVKKRTLSPGPSSTPSSPPKRQRVTPELRRLSLPIRTRGHAPLPKASSSPTFGMRRYQPQRDVGFGLSHAIGREWPALGKSSTSSVPPNSEGTLNPASTPPTQNAEGAEEDEMLNDYFAGWLIGPQEERFDIPISAINQRPHLNPRGQLLLPDGENGWKFTKPSLAELNPDKFRPAAEFLSSGDFNDPVNNSDGNPLSEEEMKTAAIELYTGAWEIAEHLTLDDLMEKIVEKMRRIEPWPLPEVLLLAGTVYARPVGPVKGDVEMRDLLTTFIVKNFWEYTRDYTAFFQGRLQQFPELGNHVYQKMADRSQADLQAD